MNITMLLERLRGLSERHPAQMVGDLSDAPALASAT